MQTKQSLLTTSTQINRIKKAVFLLPLLLLNNCAVVAIGAGVAAVGTGASVATDPRASGVVVDDNKIETKLRLKYADYDNANIYVHSYNGNVLLTGQVPNKQMQKDAEFEAKVTPGVKKIYDYLDIRLPQSFASVTTDSYTTTQVKSKVLMIKGVSSNNVKVITTNNIVYLLGVVTKSEGQDVSTASAQINGVTKVITLFEYVSVGN